MWYQNICFAFIYHPFPIPSTMVALIGVNNAFYLQQFAIVSSNGLCVLHLHGGGGHSEELGMAPHTPPALQHFYSTKLLAFRKPAQSALCLSYAYHACPQRGQQLPCQWNGVCGSGGFPMVMSRVSCRGEITLQNPVLLQVCFFDVSHSFLNMQQCKYMY